MPRGTVGQVDILEDQTSYCITMDLPNFKKENVDIEVTAENVVHINASREAVAPKEGEKYLIRERGQMHIQRSFRLPKDVQHDKVDAKLEGGVLELIVPKAEKQIPERVKVALK